MSIQLPLLALHILLSGFRKVLSVWLLILALTKCLQERRNIDVEESFEVDRKLDNILEDLWDIKQEMYGCPYQGYVVVVSFNLHQQSILEGYD